MRVSEILRIKGHTLYTTLPGGSILDAVKVMATNDIGSLVVMDRGRIVGMLTFREVMLVLAQREGALGDAIVDDIYERDPVIASPDLDINELRGVMLERHSRYVPVMDGGTLLGVVSFHDVAKAVFEEKSLEAEQLRGYINA
ncbi:MAG TPA: CBS domain-containing protein [Casimicrobiaceae bacterium]|nr:CBS domain-containing protein [Casimicrobiaceae bacterium]